MQPLDEPLRGDFGVGSVDPLLLAGALLLAQPGGAGVPVVDLAGEARADFALDLVDLGQPARLDLGQMRGDQVGDGVAERALLDAAREPRRVDHVHDCRALLRRDRPIVEIRCGAAVRGRAVRLQVDELEALRDRPRLPGSRHAAVAHGVFEVDEHARVRAIVGIVDQHRALAEQGSEALQHHVDHGVQQRVAGRQQLRLRLADDQRLLERHPRVAVEHRIAAADQPVAPLQHRRHAGDLEPAALALGDAAAQQGERLAEEGADEVGLEPPGLGALHLLAHDGDGVRVHALAGQLPLGHELLDRADIDRAVHLANSSALVSGRSP